MTSTGGGATAGYLGGSERGTPCVLEVSATEVDHVSARGRIVVRKRTHARTQDRHRTREIGCSQQGYSIRDPVRDRRVARTRTEGF